MKYIAFVRQKFGKADFPVFRIEDMKLALAPLKIKNDYLYLLVHNLLRKKEITKITKGIYTFHNEAAVVGFAFAPFYYGLENALSLRGISGQGMNFIVMTTRNVRRGVRTFQNRNYRIQYMDSKMFFGYDLLEYGAFWIPVSDLEKTVIDMIYFEGSIRDELWPEILKTLDMQKLKNHLKRYDAKFARMILEQISENKSL